jgi:hypothetical protein
LTGRGRGLANPEEEVLIHVEAESWRRIPGEVAGTGSLDLPLHEPGALGSFGVEVLGAIGAAGLGSGGVDEPEGLQEPG